MTIEGLEAAITGLGHIPVLVGSPRRLLEQVAQAGELALDAALSIVGAFVRVRGREGDDDVVETFDGRVWKEPNPR